VAIQNNVTGIIRKGKKELFTKVNTESSSSVIDEIEKSQNLIVQC
jgi:hypothetical protein